MCVGELPAASAGGYLDRAAHCSFRAVCPLSFRWHQMSFPWGLRKGYGLTSSCEIFTQGDMFVQSLGLRMSFPLTLVRFCKTQALCSPVYPFRDLPQTFENIY